MPRWGINLTRTSQRRLDDFLMQLVRRKGFKDRQAVLLAMQQRYPLPTYWWEGNVPGEFKCLLEILTTSVRTTPTVTVTTLATVTIWEGQDSSGRDCLSLKSIVRGDTGKPANCKAISLNL